MFEHVLRGDVKIAAGEEGSRHIVVSGGEHLYRIPLTADGAQSLADGLTMPADEIKARSEASQRLIVPESNGLLN